MYVPRNNYKLIKRLGIKFLKLELKIHSLFLLKLKIKLLIKLNKNKKFKGKLVIIKSKKL